MIKFLIFILIFANVIAVICLSPLLVFEYTAKIIYKHTIELFKKYFNFRKKIELNV